MYKKYLKTIFDKTAALIGLIVAFPVLLLVFAVLYFSNGSYPLFYQKRPGRKGKIFHVIKFKTMNDNIDEAGNLLPDEYRLTTVGKFIRKLSLDELPQLINVLKGEMSLIGPRPLLPQYLPLYNNFQNRRHEARPGITGWAQVNGRNAITWQQRFEYDVWYVDHISLWLDVKIFFLTIFKILKSEGINQPGQASAEPFNGNN